MHKPLTSRSGPLRSAARRGAVAAVLALPLVGTSAARAVDTAPAPTQVRAALPAGVVALRASQPCPAALFCLYQHYGRVGPAYGIRPDHDVNLHDLPMGGGGATAANNVSSWVNNTDSAAALVDLETINVRALFGHRSLKEPATLNDTVDLVGW